MYSCEDDEKSGLLIAIPYSCDGKEYCFRCLPAIIGETAVRLNWRTDERIKK